MVAGAGFVPQSLIDSSELTDSTIVRNAKNGDKGKFFIQFSFSFRRFRTKHDETFDDRAMASGIGKATQMMSGWGLKFFDYDNDGNLDLMIANGHPDDLIEKLRPGVGLSEPLLLFQNAGKGLQNVSARSGPTFNTPYKARGLALGDFNTDGAVDVLVSMNDAPPLLLKNEAGTKNIGWA